MAASSPRQENIPSTPSSPVDAKTPQRPPADGESQKDNNINCGGSSAALSSSSSSSPDQVRIFAFFLLRPFQAQAHDLPAPLSRSTMPALAIPQPRPPAPTDLQPDLVQEDSDSSSSPADIIDMDTFRQILDLDEDDTHEFSSGMAYAYFDQAATTFSEMETALYVISTAAIHPRLSSELISFPPMT